MRIWVCVYTLCVHVHAPSPSCRMSYCDPIYFLSKSANVYMSQICSYTHMQTQTHTCCNLVELVDVLVYYLMCVLYLYLKLHQTM